VVEEKNLSRDFSNFVPDQYSEGQSGVSQKFNLDEYVREAKALKTEFVHDLEQQRRVEESKSLGNEEDETDTPPDVTQDVKDETAKIQEDARKQGYQEGHEEGYQAGAQAVRDRFTSSMDALQSLVDELSEVREKTYPLLEREMVEMVTTLARKIIRAELKDKEDGIREIVRIAIESVLDRESLVIKVHPDDYNELEDYGQELIQLFHEIKNVEFESHASVPQGNCVVESNFGTVEAGLDHLDEHIERVLHLAPPPPTDTSQPDETDEPGEPEPSS
jgi:flagellar assembly protein FliH